MEQDKTSRKFESIYSTKVRAGKRRTYFFDVRKTKGEDYFITLTESTKKFNDQGYERHKIFLYKEDFNRFLSSLTETIDYIKTELMPDYDYDEFTKRNEEYERRLKEEAAKPASEVADESTESTVADGMSEESVVTETEIDTESAEAPEVDKEVTDDDMSW